MNAQHTWIQSHGFNLCWLKCLSVNHLGATFHCTSCWHKTHDTKQRGRKLSLTSLQGAGFEQRARSLTSLKSLNSPHLTHLTTLTSTHHTSLTSPNSPRPPHLTQLSSPRPPHLTQLNSAHLAQLTSAHLTALTSPHST